MDHHYAGTIPKHKNLTTLIDTSSNTCTSLLINQHLKGQFIDWAIVGAFGDNLITTTTRPCRSEERDKSISSIIFGIVFAVDSIAPVNG